MKKMLLNQKTMTRIEELALMKVGAINLIDANLINCTGVDDENLLDQLLINLQYYKAVKNEIKQLQDEN